MIVELYVTVESLEIGFVLVQNPKNQIRNNKQKMILCEHRVIKQLVLLSAIIGHLVSVRTNRPPNEQGGNSILDSHTSADIRHNGTSTHVILLQ